MTLIIQITPQIISINNKGKLVKRQDRGSILQIINRLVGLMKMVSGFFWRVCYDANIVYETHHKQFSC